MKRLTDEEIKEICKDCYCPDIDTVRYEVANTPIYLRRYFMEIGRVKR